MNRLENNVTEVAVPRPANGHAKPPDFGDQMKPSRLVWIAVAVVLVIAVALVAGLIPRMHQRAGQVAQTHELALPTVNVVSPAPAKLGAAVPLPAEIRPLTEAPIYARASGYLKKWFFDLGSQVQAGQLLAEIDTPELDQELAKARAEVTQAEAALALAKTTGARWAELLKTSSVSEQENAEKQADLALKTANLEAARAAVRRLDELKSFARVLAPFAGTITARRVDVGELIRADTGRELFRLAQTSTLRVFVRTPQPMARAMIPGTKAEITIPELVGRVFTGKVVRTAGAMDPDSRTLLTEIELDNSKGEVLSGTFAQVRFAGANIEAPLTVPANSLLFRAEGTLTAIAHDDGKVELRRVTLGRDLGAMVEIVDGVSATDHLIVNPPDSLVNGSMVRIASTTQPAHP